VTRAGSWVSIVLVIVASALVPSCAGQPTVSVSSAPGFAGLNGAKIGVTAFTCTDQSFGNAVTDSFANDLLGQGCKILERTALANLLMEQNLQVSGLTGAIDASRIGQLAKVDYLLVGSVALHQQVVVGRYAWDDSGTVQLVDGASARILDAKTGEVVRSVTYQPGRGKGWHKPNVVGSEMAKSMCSSKQ
jgi:curli biogenesis system outer membrane secretion channel CsgG